MYKKYISIWNYVIKHMVKIKNYKIFRFLTIYIKASFFLMQDVYAIITLNFKDLGGLCFFSLKLYYIYDLFVEIKLCLV
jgi:hypothetical protein